MDRWTAQRPGRARKSMNDTARACELEIPKAESESAAVQMGQA